MYCFARFFNFTHFAICYLYSYLISIFRYFAIDTDKRMLTVKQSLTLDSNYPEFYKFEVIASDQGTNPRTDTAYVHINVNRGFQRDIGFNSSNYMLQILKVLVYMKLPLVIVFEK